MPLPFIRPGYWYEIPSSRLDTSGVMETSAPGDEAGIMGAWSGGCYDSTRERLIVWGGGHGDYAGNEIYAFSLTALTWSKVRAGSTLWGGDETTGYYPDGGGSPDVQQPRSRHTRSYLDYSPEADSMCCVAVAAMYPSGSIFAPNTDIFRFATGLWERKADHPDWAAGTNSGAFCGYDSVSKKIIRHGVTTNKFLSAFDPVAGTYQTRGPASGTFYERDVMAAVDPVNRRFVMVGTGQCVSWDLVAQSGVSGQSLSTTGGASIVSASGPGLAFDPIENRLVAWIGGTSVYTLNLSTLVWTQRTPDAGNTVNPGTPAAAGTFGRFRYSAKLNLFVVVNSISSNVFVYRLNPAPVDDATYTITEPALTVPSPGVPYADPTFGGSNIRIQSVYPEYSELQAWNSDQTLLLVNAGATRQVRDASSYALLHTIDYGAAPDFGRALRWSPIDPLVLYYLDFANTFGSGATLLKYSLTPQPSPTLWTRTRSLVRHFTEYIQFEADESFEELSEDGRYIALIGKRAVVSSWGHVFDAFVYDVISNIKHVPLELPVDITFGPRSPDHIAMSPSGGHALMWWASGTSFYQGIEAYTKDMVYAGKVSTAQYPHSTLCREADGTDVVVLDNANNPYLLSGNHYIVKAKVPVGVLFDGSGNVDSSATINGGYSVALLQLDWQHNVHISGTNRNARGWVVVSTYAGQPGYDNGWQPFEDEVFRVFLDSTVTTPHVSRVAHHRSHAGGLTGRDACPGESEYFAQPHATASPNGNKIFWGSNFENICTVPHVIDGVVLSSSADPVIPSTPVGNVVTSYKLEGMP